MHNQFCIRAHRQHPLYQVHLQHHFQRNILPIQLQTTQQGKPLDTIQHYQTSLSSQTMGWKAKSSSSVDGRWNRLPVFAGCISCNLCSIENDIHSLFNLLRLSTEGENQFKGMRSESMNIVQARSAIGLGREKTGILSKCCLKLMRTIYYIF